MSKNKKHIVFNSVEEALNEISSQLNPPAKRKKHLFEERFRQQHKKSKIRQLSFNLLKVAGVALLAMFSFLWSGNVNVQTAFAENNQHYLPDSSLVILDAASSIAYNKYTYNWSRKLNMKGKAFFQVKKGERFQVEVSDHNKVEVLGTSFDINSRSSEFLVKCFSGKVKVDTKVSIDTLVPGDFVKLKRNRSYVGKHKESEPKWVQGEFLFQESGIHSVLNEIQRQFNVKINYKGSSELSYTGGFKSDEIERALDLVCLPLALQYELDKQKRLVTIKPE